MTKKLIFLLLAAPALSAQNVSQIKLADATWPSGNPPAPLPRPAILPPSGVSLLKSAVQ
jgi:hypothetical protein